MKRLLLIASLLAGNAQSQEFSCPKFYPWQDTVQAEVPYGHHGKGVVAKNELRDAGVFWGDFNRSAEVHGGPGRKVKGGSDTAFPRADWLVCWYGPGQAIAWWEELKLAKGVRGCTLQLRDGGRDPMDVKLVCK